MEAAGATWNIIGIGRGYRTLELKIPPTAFATFDALRQSNDITSTLNVVE